MKSSLAPERSNASPHAIERQVLLVDGMFCAACAASVEAALTKVPGVARAAVNFAADAAVVEWRPGQGDRSRLAQAIASLGYRSRTVDDPKPSRADPTRGFVLRLVVAVFFGMWSMLPTVGLYLDVSSDPQIMRALAVAAGVFALPVVVYSGWPFYLMAFRTLRVGAPGVDALVATGVLGAVGLSIYFLVSGRTEVYFEVAVALITFQLLARVIDARVRRRARDAVARLTELAPSEVAVIDEQGREQQILLKALPDNARIRLRAGDRIAVDGTVRTGRGLVDRSLLSGESSPVAISGGDSVNAGEQLVDGELIVAVTAGAGKRRIDLIARHVRQLLAQKAPWQQLVETLARRFLLIAAILAGLVWLGVGLQTGNFSDGAVRALAVFVIACPCALSLAAPLATLFASAAASRCGIVLRDLAALTHAANPDRLFLDKTGTLTRGRPEIGRVHCLAALDEHQLLATAALAERGSVHPIARAICAAADSRDDRGECAAVVGQGAVWRYQDTTVIVGKGAYLASQGVDLPELPDTDATRVWVARDGMAVGAIDLRDDLRPGSRRAIAELRDRGVRCEILSGDAEGPVHWIADTLEIDARSGLSPEDKSRIIDAARVQGHVVAFAGDGLNDGPALAAADLGVAVSQCSDAARAAAAVTLLKGGVEQIPVLLGITRKSQRIIRQNLIASVAYNVVAIPAAVSGLIHPALAAVAMALSSLSVVVNSARLGRIDYQLAAGSSSSS